MPTITDTITTPDGTCPVTLCHSRGRRPVAAASSCTPTPAVHAPPVREMAEQLAGYGYAVLVPDVYYRDGDWAPFDMKTVFGDQDERTAADVG